MIVNLSDYRTNNFSQNGEDGVIEKIFEIAGIKSGFLVEFGAWDGIYYSNARHHFLNNPAFNLLMIEPNPDRFEQLKNNYPEPTAILVNSYVHFDKSPTLNDIFSEKNISDIALLSIDVDGDDFDIWKSLDTERFRPKVVIIEFGKWQNSELLEDMQSYFDSCGYELVCITGNFIFVDRKLGISSSYQPSNRNIHDLMKTSGLPEYDQFYGLIDQDEVNSRNVLKETQNDIYCKQAGPQTIEYLK